MPVVIGRPNSDATYESALRAERRTGKPVNVTIRSPEAWSQMEDGFLEHVAGGSLIPIIQHEAGEPDGCAATRMPAAARTHLASAV